MSSSYSIRIRFSGDEKVLTAAEEALRKVETAAREANRGNAWPSELAMLEDSALSEVETDFLDEVFSYAGQQGLEAWDVVPDIQGIVFCLLRS